MESDTIKNLSMANQLPAMIWACGDVTCYWDQFFFFWFYYRLISLSIWYIQEICDFLYLDFFLYPVYMNAFIAHAWKEEWSRNIIVLITSHMPIRL